jgi:acetylornithine deacetylase
MKPTTELKNQVISGQSVLPVIKQHLAFLIEQDTCNPPRNIKGSDVLFVELKSFFEQQNFIVEIADFGGGHVAFYALRGSANVLFNVHLDTVPVSAGWQNDPFKLIEVDGRFYGRGTCDIKGAAACLMALAETSTKDMAVMFSTDEEGTENCCIENFINGHDLSAYQQVIVAEPTLCQAVTEHRGYVSSQGQFKGISGHSSSVSALAGNAIHQANQWLNAAIEHAKSCQSEENPAGICFNLGSIVGGEKNNMIAEHCKLGFSIRVPAGTSSQAAYDWLVKDIQSNAQWHCSLMAPALPEQADGNQQAIAFCKQHGLEQGPAVNFWTEASLFSQAGIPALVLGPGDIAQAHTVDEWVAIDQLSQCFEIYQGVL